MAAAKTGPSRPFTEVEITDALMALIAYAGNGPAACRYLRSQGKRAPNRTTLQAWAQTLHWERYQELREKYAAQIESSMVNDYRDAARSATEAQRLAIEKARARLAAGKDPDPGRTAANLGRAAAMSTEKMLALSGRPSQITESRDIGPILRSLVAKGVLHLDGEASDAQPELEANGQPERESGDE